MKILVTGSSGHLGEALVRTLRKKAHEVIGLDVLASLFTTHIGSVTDKQFVRECMQGVDAVLHTATLHKPHIGKYSYQHFVDTNITGTLNLLEEAVLAKVTAFIYTSTTSTFGDALQPKKGAPAVWIDETVRPIPKNIYGVTKTAAEDLCQIFHRDNDLPCMILRTSRFFPEEDDNRLISEQYDQCNVQANELLYRRIDLADVVEAHLSAIQRAKEIGFGRYIISASSPFSPKDLSELAYDAPRVVKRLFPDYEEIYQQLGWKMFPTIERVYINTLAKKELGWEPAYHFRHLLDSLKQGHQPVSDLTLAVGKKSYK